MTTIHVEQEKQGLHVTSDDKAILGWLIGLTTLTAAAVSVVMAEPAAVDAAVGILGGVGMAAVILFVYSAALVSGLALQRSRSSRRMPRRADAPVGRRRAGEKRGGEERTRVMPAVPVDAYGPSGVMPPAEHGAWTPLVAPGAADRPPIADTRIDDELLNGGWAEHIARQASREATR